MKAISHQRLCGKASAAITLGQVLIEIKQPGHAALVLQRAKRQAPAAAAEGRIDPEEWEGLRFALLGGLGLASQIEGRLDRALAAYQQALESDAAAVGLLEHASLFVPLLRLYADLGQEDTALQVGQAWLEELSPTDPEAQPAHLHTNRSQRHWSALTCHQAPHKPLLLLAVLDLVASDDLTPDFLLLTPRLIATFEGYWQTIPGLTERVGNPVLPFFHLRYERFWRLMLISDQEQTLSEMPQSRLMGQIRQCLLGARVEPDLAVLLAIPDAREALRQVLIETYFAPEVQLALFKCGRVATEAAAYRQELVTLARQQFILMRAPELRPLYLQEARAAGFRQVVVEAYQHTCAICRLRLVTPEGHTAVEAAHIVPWSRSRNDDPRNGLALCRLHHWTFDQGLVGIQTDGVIEVAALVQQGDNQAASVQTFRKQTLSLPLDPALSPAREALRWHWRHVFRRNERPPGSQLELNV